MEQKIDWNQKETELIYTHWKFVLKSSTSGRKIWHYHEKWQRILNSACERDHWKEIPYHVVTKMKALEQLKLSQVFC